MTGYSSCDGVLVWVDPLSGGKDRSDLDSILRDLASRGVWVGSHPDVIMKMGTKEVLYRTRDPVGAAIPSCMNRSPNSEVDFRSG